MEPAHKGINMKKVTVVLGVFLSCMAGLLYAQTAQQAQLLQNRINVDSLQINADIQEINRIQAIIVDKQNEIDNLNAEVQGAEDFLNPPINADVNLDTQGTVKIQ